MTDNNIVFGKLIALSDAAEHLSEKLISTEHGIAAARQRLTGGMKPAEYEDLRASLDRMIADLPALKRRATAAQTIYKNCREFVDDLPKGATLELVEVKTDGRTLEEVRAKIKALETELAALNSAPSSDIEERFRAYVEGLAKPTITGVGKGEKLRVFWPGAGFGPSDPNEHKAEVLPLMALLFPDQLVAALLGLIEQTSTSVVPDVLIAQIEQLAYLEEQLVAAAIANGKDVQRSPSAPPQAVLGVRIVEAAKKPRAA